MNVFTMIRSVFGCRALGAVHAQNDVMIEAENTDRPTS